MVVFDFIYNFYIVKTILKQELHILFLIYVFHNNFQHKKLFVLKFKLLTE